MPLSEWMATTVLEVVMTPTEAEDVVEDEEGLKSPRPIEVFMMENQNAQ